MKQPTLFSMWMRDNLKDAFSGLITQDIDFIILNDEQKFFIVEEKNFARARTSPAQAVIYKMIDEILQLDSSFLGCHKATYENGGVWLDQTGRTSLKEFLRNPNIYRKNEYGHTWFDSILYFSLKYLWDGKGEPPYHKTQKEKYFSRDSLLEPELEKYGVKKYSIDWIFVNYVSGYFVLLSESECFKEPIIKQIISDFEKYNSNDKKVYNPKSKCMYKFLGAYEIEYNSSLSKFKINGEVINREDAIRIFNLDSDEITKFL